MCENLQKGFSRVALIYAIIYGLCHLICYFGIKGYEKDYNTTSSNYESYKSTNFSIKNSFLALIKNKYCLIICLCYILYLFYISIMNSSLVYYIQYNLKDTSLMAYYSIISNVVSIAPIFIMKFLVNKFGNAKSCAIGCLITVVAEIIRLITKDQYIPILFICWALEGIGVGLCSYLITQCMFDSIIYGKWKTGVNNEAILMSTLSFSQKCGQSMGGVISAYILTLVPYVTGAKSQTQSVLNIFFIENVICPLAFYIILFTLFMYISKLEKNIPLYKKEIEHQ